MMAVPKRFRGIPAALLALAVSLPAAAHAQSGDATRLQITPFGGYRFWGGVEDYYTGASLDLDANVNYGVVASFKARPGYWVEFTWDRQATTVDVFLPGLVKTELDIALDNWSIGGAREIPTNNPAVQPFVGGMLGFTHISSPNEEFDSEDRFLLGFDLGTRLMPNPRIGFRLDSRLYMTLVNGGGTVWVGSGGAQVAWGGDVFIQGEVTGGLVISF